MQSPKSNLATWLRGLSQRGKVIAGSSLIVGVCALLSVCAAIGNALPSNSVTNTANQGGQSATATRAPIAHATATPKPRPTVTPRPATATPAPRYPAINGNPYDFTFTNTGKLVYSPPGDICNWFNCIASFWNGTGFMNECGDATYSMSGGHQGDCSHHGGEWRPVYQP